MSRPETYGEAESLLARFLASTETLTVFGEMTLTAPTGRSEGVGYVTNYRLYFWMDGDESPREIARGVDMDGVDIDERYLAGGFHEITLRLVSSERIAFYGSEELGAALTRLSNAVRPTTKDSAPPPDPVPPPASPASGSQERKSEAPKSHLPRGYRSIPVRPVDAYLFRSLDPDTLDALSGESRAFGASAAAMETREVSDALGVFVDPLLRQIRSKMEGAMIAPCPPEGIQNAVYVGTSIALAERLYGWTDWSTVHPVVHINLYFLQERLTSDYGLGAALPLEAAFRCARINRFDDTLIRT